jgi:hypothetical protein
MEALIHLGRELQYMAAEVIALFLCLFIRSMTALVFYFLPRMCLTIYDSADTKFLDCFLMMGWMF